MATLAVYRGDQFLRHVELGETPTRIGRSPENELVLEDKGKGVSRSHAKILYEQGRYVIVDANSQNGVWIGNRKITRDVLPVDVPVTIGPYRLRLVPEPQASTGPLIPTEGEDRLIDPTELVGSGVQIPAAQAIPAQSSATQAKSAESSAAQAKPAQSSATQGKSAQSPAAQGKSAQSSTVQGKSAQSSAAQAKPAQSSPTHVTPARAGVESAPWPRKRVLVASVAVVGVVGLLATVLIIANARRSPAPVVALPSAPPVTPPSGPTVEQQFRDHYDKAQGYIEKGDKAAAATENAEALKLLPSDTRGLEQQTRVVAMIDPTTPPEPPPVETPADGGKTATGLIPPPPKPERSTLMVAPIAGETASQRSEREKRARDHLDDGKKALEERRYSTAVSLFQAAINSSQREDYGATKDEAKTLLQSARDAMAAAESAQKRATVQKLVTEAKALANSDIVGAVRRLREARNLDPQVSAEATELLNRLQEQARVEGEAALVSAKNFENYKRTDEAIRDYDKAVQLLELVPGGHQDLAAARQRSANLKKPR